MSNNQADSDVLAVQQRNQLRQEAGLPAVSIAEELKKLKWARRRREFERYFEEITPRLRHIWEVPGSGWMTQMGLHEAVRFRILQCWEPSDLGNDDHTQSITDQFILELQNDIMRGVEPQPSTE